MPSPDKIFEKYLDSVDHLLAAIYILQHNIDHINSKYSAMIEPKWIQNIRRKIFLKNLKPSWVAKKVGISPSRFKNILNGTSLPDKELIKRIKNAIA